MIENYKFGKLAGPSGVIAGYTLLFFGLATLYFTLTSIPVLLLGGFMAFSYKGSKIRFDKKRYQTYLTLFGFIRIGVWLPFEKSDTISVMPCKGKYTSFSRSKRRSEAEIQEFRIILSTSYNDKIIPIALFQNENKAKEKAAELKNLIDALKI
jgi:hypothetical protein